MTATAPRRRLPARTVAAGGPGARERAAQATRDGILRAALEVFARHGYDGGRIEQISKAAGSYDRMIYYYFGSKEQLFVEVLEEIYRRFNEAEAGLAIDLDRPVQALESVIRFVCGYYRDHPEFVTLLNTENLHKGRHIARSQRAREYSSPAIGVIGAILASGAKQGLFRADVRARDVYLMIASMGYFYQSNRHTLSAFLGEDLGAADAQAGWERFVIEAVIGLVRSGG
jgi:AcrR family transcriptional regulator